MDEQSASRISAKTSASCPVLAAQPRLRDPDVWGIAQLAEPR